MTINWKVAPDWANYAAQDEDGDWYWYGTEPVVCVSAWGYSGMVEIIFLDNCPNYRGSWDHSLQQRPKLETNDE